MRQFVSDLFWAPSAERAAEFPSADAIIFEATDVVKAIGGVSPSILLSGRRAVLPSAGSSARQPASLGGLGSTLAELEPCCRTVASPAGVCWETVVLGIGCVMCAVVFKRLGVRLRGFHAAASGYSNCTWVRSLVKPGSPPKPASPRPFLAAALPVSASAPFRITIVCVCVLRRSLCAAVGRGRASRPVAAAASVLVTWLPATGGPADPAWDTRAAGGWSAEPNFFSSSPIQPSSFRLSCSYEEPSPKIKRRRPSLSPYQLTLHDVDASLLCSLRGLPCELQADAAAGTLRWGPLFLRLCDPSALQRLLGVLRRVNVIPADLSHLSTGLASLATDSGASGAREASGSEPVSKPVSEPGMLRPPPLRVCPKQEADGGGAASPGPVTPTLGAGSDFAAKQLSVCLSTLGRGNEAAVGRAGLPGPASGFADALERLGTTSAAEAWLSRRPLAGHPLVFGAAGVGPLTPLTPQASAALVLTPLEASRRRGSESDFSAPPLTPGGPLASANWQRRVPAGASP